MRENKFRAWYPLKNKMIFLEECRADKWFWFFNDVTLKRMQYTGLKDKNGKEIYEGDMLRISFREDFQIVRYAKDGYFATSEFALFELIRDEGYTYEVVGNIYENPELLEVWKP